MMAWNGLLATSLIKQVSHGTTYYSETNPIAQHSLWPASRETKTSQSVFDLTEISLPRAMRWGFHRYTLVMIERSCSFLSDFWFWINTICGFCGCIFSQDFTFRHSQCHLHAAEKITVGRPTLTGSSPSEADWICLLRLYAFNMTSSHATCNCHRATVVDRHHQRRQKCE